MNTENSDIYIYAGEIKEDFPTERSYFIFLHKILNMNDYDKYVDMEIINGMINLERIESHDDNCIIITVTDNNAIITIMKCDKEKKDCKIPDTQLRDLIVKAYKSIENGKELFVFKYNKTDRHLRACNIFDNDEVNRMKNERYKYCHCLPLEIIYGYTTRKITYL